MEGAQDLSLEQSPTAATVGIVLKQAYLEIIMRTAAESSDAFSQLVVDAVESVATQTAGNLEQSYKRAELPRMDDSAAVAIAFVSRFLSRFREAVCAELYANPDVSGHARSLLVVLTPTVLTLLALPLAYAALAIPISILVTRIGTRALCEGIEDRRKEKQSIQERLELHRRNLVAIETTLGGIKSGELCDVLRESILSEQETIRQLQEELKTFSGDNATL